MFPSARSRSRAGTAPTSSATPTGSCSPIPENKASKITSKKGVLEGILGYSPEGDVRIDYFKPLADHKVAWNFIQFRGWGGHRMRMQFTWEGTDSVLAAPLVIDIARLRAARAAARRVGAHRSARPLLQDARRARPR
jgi:myo-inositol-1-phosphate synthase